MPIDKWAIFSKLISHMKMPRLAGKLGNLKPFFLIVGPKNFSSTGAGGILPNPSDDINSILIAKPKDFDLAVQRLSLDAEPVRDALFIGLTTTGAKVFSVTAGQLMNAMQTELSVSKGFVLVPQQVLVTALLQDGISIVNEP